jgi:hypothetical protein
MEERKMGRRKDAKRSVARSVELDWKGSGGGFRSSLVVELITRYVGCW